MLNEPSHSLPYCLIGTALAGLGVLWLSRGPAGTEPGAWAGSSAPSSATTVPVPHVEITLFDPSGNDDTLVPIRAEIPQSPNATDHGRLVVEAALERAASPDVGLWPPGIALRTYYAAAGGEVIVDLTGMPARGLGGGTTAERLALQSLLSAIHANVPGASSVRLLVEGQVASMPDTHLDLREPLAAADTLRQAPIGRAGP